MKPTLFPVIKVFVYPLLATSSGEKVIQILQIFETDGRAVGRNLYLLPSSHGTGYVFTYEELKSARELKIIQEEHKHKRDPLGGFWKQFSREDEKKIFLIEFAKACGEILPKSNHQHFH